MIGPAQGQSMKRVVGMKARCGGENESRVQSGWYESQLFDVGTNAEHRIARSKSPDQT